MGDDDVQWGPYPYARPYAEQSPKKKPKRRQDGDTPISPAREQRYQDTRARLAADDDGGDIKLGETPTSRLASAYRGRRP